MLIRLAFLLALIFFIPSPALAGGGGILVWQQSSTTCRNDGQCTIDPTTGSKCIHQSRCSADLSWWNWWSRSGHCEYAVVDCGDGFTCNGETGGCALDLASPRFTFLPTTGLCASDMDCSNDSIGQQVGEALVSFSPRCVPLPGNSSYGVCMFLAADAVCPESPQCETYTDCTATSKTYCDEAGDFVAFSPTCTEVVCGEVPITQDCEAGCTVEGCVEDPGGLGATCRPDLSNCNDGDPCTIDTCNADMEVCEHEYSSALCAP